MNQVYRPAKGAKIDLTMMAHLWNNEEMSATEIAASLGGVSRAAVLGYVHRNKDLFKPRKQGAPRYARTGGRKPQRKPPGEQRVKPTHNNVGNKARDMHNTRKARMEATRREADEFAAGTSEYLKIAPSDAERLPMGKELMDLGTHDCRWALTNGGPWIFCSAATDDGAVYCDHHAKRAYRAREAWQR